MNQRKLVWVVAALAPVVLALAIWMLIACLTYLQAPAGHGGASIDASGKLVVGHKAPDLKTPLVLSAVTVPLGIVWMVLLVLWKRAVQQGSKLPAAGAQENTGRAGR